MSNGSSCPCVSIITPSYNQGRFLEETVRSVLLQGYPNLEYMVIDGGSTDESVEIIRRYADWLAYWVSEPDRGQVDAINKGFGRATGEILAWLNSDDTYVHPRTIFRVVDLFRQYPQVDAVTGAGMILTEDGRWLRQTEVLPTRSYYEQLRYRDTILQPATFFRRKVLDSIPIDESLHYTFDWDFFIRLTKHHNLLVVDEVWAGCRMWEENKTVSGGAARTQEQVEVLRRYLGTKSWQYWVLRFFHLQYRIAETMPSNLQSRLKRAIRGMSRIASTLSFRRLPVV
jgi:glycosyltransferase involved in cell wall biosynthesis